MLGLPFFKATPIALVIVLAAIVLTVRLFKPIASAYGFLEKSFFASWGAGEKSGSPAHLKRLAPWEHQLVRFKLSPDSEFAGKTLMESALRKSHGINVIAIQRGSRMIAPPHPEQQLFPKDELLVLGGEDRLESIRERVEGSETAPLPMDQLENYELRAFQIPRTSDMGGKTLREVDLRRKYGVLITGLQRGENRILNPDSELTLLPLDTLWMVGEYAQLERIVGEWSTEEATREQLEKES